MATIGICLNEVLRDFLGQLTYTYNKYIAKDGPLDLMEGDVKEFDLLKYFKFDSKEKLNDFLYSEAPLEIFGHADQMREGVFVKLNKFVMDMIDEEEHEVVIVSREFNRSIPATLFFLAKVGCLANNIKFVPHYEDKWEGIDVLITANPITLNSKPEGKISIKVNASYNTDVKSDYEIESIEDFIESSALRSLILL